MIYNSNEAYFYMVVSKTSLPLIKQNNSQKTTHGWTFNPPIKLYICIWTEGVNQNSSYKVQKKIETQKCYKKQVDQSVWNSHVE